MAAVANTPPWMCSRTARRVIEYTVVKRENALVHLALAGSCWTSLDTCQVRRPESDGAMRACLLLTLAQTLWAQDASIHDEGFMGCDPTATAAVLASSPISACSATFDSEDLLLATSCADVAADEICRMIRRGWWRGAKKSLTAVPDDSRAQIRKFLEAYRTGAGSVIQALQSRGDGRSVITPACQWAQNTSVIALMVRYSPKKHGPVSVANVDEPRVSLNATHLQFDALANPRAESGKKPLRFSLEVCARARSPACRVRTSLTRPRAPSLLNLLAARARRPHRPREVELERRLRRPADSHSRQGNGRALERPRA